MTHLNSVYYNAYLSRDSRFGGVFYIGVTSAGIYCRPICTVKTPKKGICQFFNNAEAAEKASFRPCLRVNLGKQLYHNTIALQLTYRPPYDWEGILKFLTIRTLKGVEQIETNSYYRIIQLVALPGIGTWTAHYIAMRALRWTNAFLKDDIVVCNNLGGITAKEAELMSNKWRPWRSYATLHIWQKPINNKERYYD